jgi:SapC
MTPRTTIFKRLIMASNAPANSNSGQNASLPLFYQSLVPVQTNVHGELGMVERTTFPFARTANAIPITIDEFVMAQRFYPIVFTPQDDGAPLALVGMADGDNLFVDADGNWRQDTYVPAYVRRYPFLLAKLTPEAQDLSLCFDDSSDLLNNSAEQKLFAGTEASELTKNVLQFCEQFEMAVQRTQAFMKEMNEMKLLQDTEANATINGQSMNFRGFKAVDEKVLQDLRGDQARKLVKNGMLGLVYAHLFSLSNMQGLMSLAQSLGRLPNQLQANPEPFPINLN